MGAPSHLVDAIRLLKFRNTEAMHFRFSSILGYENYFNLLVCTISAQAEAILVKAQATNKGLALVSQSIKENGGAEVSFHGL